LLAFGWLGEGGIADGCLLVQDQSSIAGQTESIHVALVMNVDLVAVTEK